jgi:hypothetical protein
VEVSSFIIRNALEQELTDLGRLDSLRSPAMTSNSRFATSPMASPVVSSDHAQAMWS